MASRNQKIETRCWWYAMGNGRAMPLPAQVAADWQKMPDRKPRIVFGEYADAAAVIVGEAPAPAPMEPGEQMPMFDGELPEIETKRYVQCPMQN